MGKKKRRGEEAAVMRKKKRGRKKSLELTEDLIIDIISRVPEKNLMRFTCVSKSWRSLIVSSDSYLSKLRSHRTALLDRPFLIIQKEEIVRGDELYYNYWLELDSIEDGNPKPREIHNPFDDDDNCPRRDAIVIGSCEGLFVLQECSTYKMAVSNPTTKKHHFVPPNPAGDDNVDFVGFGYDHVHGCYKLVTKIEHESRRRDVELMTYNVTNCTWKKSRFDALLDDEGIPRLSDKGKCYDGALYWCDQMEMRKILCFVLAEEELHEVDPPYFDDDEDPSSSLTVFDGRLCLVCCKGQRRDYGVKLWLMECDYKRPLGSSNFSRWIEFLVISDPEAMLPRGFTRLNLIPICFSACENKILFNVDYSQLFWYDLGKYKFRELKNRINYKSGYQGAPVTSCVPNLVRIGIS